MRNCERFAISDYIASKEKSCFQISLCIIFKGRYRLACHDEYINMKMKAEHKSVKLLPPKRLAIHG